MLAQTLHSDQIWYKRISVLWERPSELMPTRDQSDAERTNAMVRLVLYCSVSVALIKYNPMYAVLGAMIVAILSLTYAYGVKKTKNESYGNIRPSTVKSQKKACSPSTPNNPFSNATVGALLEDPARAPACSYDDPGMAEQIRENFNRGLYRNLDDVYETENSFRQYVTNPVTTAAPDTNGFAQFLYGPKSSTCKENTKNCMPYFSSRT